MIKKERIQKDEKKQYDLNLKFSRFEVFYALIRRAKSIEKRFTVLPFWRGGLIWTAIISIFAITFITIILVLNNYDNLPPNIPLIYDTIEERWESYPKLYILSIPSLLAVLGIINIKFLQKVYYMNKRLTLMVCLLLTIIYFLGLIGINEIISLSTS